MKEKLLKVIAEVQEIPVEPEFHAVFVCGEFEGIKDIEKVITIKK